MFPIKLSDDDMDVFEAAKVPKLLLAFVEYKLPKPSSFIIGFIDVLIDEELFTSVY